MQEKNLGNEADFKTILDHLQAVYCGKIAYEFMHLPVSLNKFLTTLYQILNK
jgi:2-oxoglutarate dehydrogenase complex dehydrogenase (E1) component-like enzyme